MDRPALNEFAPRELLRLYGSILDDLHSRGIVRTSNNPVSDYTEWLVSTRLNLKLAGNSEKGFDATSYSDGLKYEIKARRVTPANKSRQLSAIRDIEGNHFDFLIAVVYDKKESTLSNIKISISDFNQKYFQNDDLRISNIFLDQEATIPIIMIRKFDSAAQALRYFNSVKSNKNQFISDQIRHEVYPISQSNYRKLYATKDVESYKEFFNINYKD